MSREIRFRAWDKENKKMTVVNETLDILVSMNNRVFGLMKDDMDSLREINRENTVIMQSIGLKDKNGVEIFEGDIYLYQAYGGNKTYVVEYDKDRGGFFPFATDDGCKCCAAELVLESEDGRVIGNTWENPELLEESK